MTFYTAAEIARERAEWADDLLDECSIRPFVEVTDAVSGKVKTWPVVSATVACGMSDGAGSPQRSDAWDDSSLPGARTLYLIFDAPIEVGFHVERNGETWDVLDVQKPSSTSLGTICQVTEVAP